MFSDKSALDARMHMQFDLAMGGSMLQRERVLASADLVAYMPSGCCKLWTANLWNMNMRDPCSASRQVSGNANILNAVFEVCPGSREPFRYLCQSQLAQKLLLITLNICYPLNNALP